MKSVNGLEVFKQSFPGRTFLVPRTQPARLVVRQVVKRVQREHHLEDVLDRRVAVRVHLLLKETVHKGGAHGPNVHLRTVRARPKEQFRRTVGGGDGVHMALGTGVHRLAHAKVNELARLGLLKVQQVTRFDVAVDVVEPVHVLKR